MQIGLGIAPGACVATLVVLSLVDKILLLSKYGIVHRPRSSALGAEELTSGEGVAGVARKNWWEEMLKRGKKNRNGTNSWRSLIEGNGLLLAGNITHWYLWEIGTTEEKRLIGKKEPEQNQKEHPKSNKEKQAALCSKKPIQMNSMNSELAGERHKRL